MAPQTMYEFEEHPDSCFKIRVVLLNTKEGVTNEFEWARERSKKESKQEAAYLAYCELKGT